MMQVDIVNDSATTGSSTQIVTQRPVILNLPSNSSVMSAVNVRPLPKAQKRKETRQGRPKGVLKIITDTLEKLALQAMKSNDAKKELKNVKTIQKKFYSFNKKS
ncbi:hypothetical protein AVEN_206485-1 [Araneus ventricosus]|uniref:Uncharacterized protein n=1 Tax=Araneus ventricosus TaxID=182803 RepID=A0A4Y2SXF5_ARAVE|nr:hypothetical protein AVEN_206485-1 [Araneus ventricosus]